ncbi:hypothetical protein EYY27_00900 [Escherichia coli]|nr:hypothetical protein EYY27_00900 [Escherichia coli]TII79768.1 hypothetical protein EYY25_01780 [Escherichia coli]
MMSLWDALRMNMMISYQELVRTFLRSIPYTPFSHKKSHVGFASYPEHGSRLRLAECLADR